MMKNYVIKRNYSYQKKYKKIPPLIRAEKKSVKDIGVENSTVEKKYPPVLIGVLSGACPRCYPRFVFTNEKLCGQRQNGTADSLFFRQGQTL
jgi:hypothetical protein